MRVWRLLFNEFLTQHTSESRVIPRRYLAIFQNAVSANVRNVSKVGTNALVGLVPFARSLYPNCLRDDGSHEAIDADTLVFSLFR